MLRNRSAQLFFSVLVVFMSSWFSTQEAHAQACPVGKFCYYVPPALATPSGYSIDWDLVIASSFGTVSGTYKIGNAAAISFSVTPSTPEFVPLSPTEGVVGSY